MTAPVRKVQEETARLDARLVQLQAEVESGVNRSVLRARAKRAILSGAACNGTCYCGRCRAS